MPERRRIKQTLSLKDRLSLFSKKAIDEAEKLPPGPERDELIKKARKADTASNIDAWANSPGLQPPK